MTSWTDLPLDLLFSILRCLPTIVGLRCSAVSSAWRSAVRRLIFPPLLMLSSSSPTAAAFFTIADKSLHVIRLPDPPISDRLWIGSSAGYLVTADPTSQVLIVNPLTGVQSPLPPTATLPHVAAFYHPNGQISGYRYRNKILSLAETRLSLFAKAITDPNSPIVVLILNSAPTLAFARVGDEAWTPLEKSIPVHDVILHKGLLYSIDFMGKVESWDLNCSNSPPKATASIFPQLQSDGFFVDKYLVESSRTRQLLQVWRMVGSVRVFQGDAKRGRWVELGSIGDEALFLGNNHSMSLSSTEFKELKGNCIYFTETSHIFPPAGCRNWVYSLGDGSSEPCFGSCDSMSDWPLPIWIVPRIS